MLQFQLLKDYQKSRLNISCRFISISAISFAKLSQHGWDFVSVFTLKTLVIRKWRRKYLIMFIFSLPSNLDIWDLLQKYFEIVFKYSEIIVFLYLQYNLSCPKLRARSYKYWHIFQVKHVKDFIGLDDWYSFFVI